MQEKKETFDLDFKDAMQELINIGLGKAARVISELSDSHVKMGVVKVYPATSLASLSLFSSYVVVQEVEGDILNGKTIFSMIDDELLKLLKHLEVIEELEEFFSSENLEMILDAYQEIGNIILGNIVSSIVDYLDDRVEIRLPFLSDKKVFDDFKSSSYIIADVLFVVDALDARGELCLIIDLKAYNKLAEKLRAYEV